LELIEKIKPYLFTILFAIFLTSSFGQTIIEGTYLDDRDTLTFKSDSVSLSIMSNGGLIFPINGNGEYSITENTLIIKTGENPNKPIEEKTHRELGDTKYLINETIIFKISNQKENQLELILLGICDNKVFNGLKTIKKFERDHKRNIYRKRALKKKN
jgi:hypothetical protein